MAFSKPKKVSFFSKMKLDESDRVLRSIAQDFTMRMDDRVVAESLMQAFDDNTLHTFPDFVPALSRLSLRDYQWYRRVTALRSKSDDVDLGIDKEAVAWNSYCESELRCAATNRRLSDYSSWEKSLPGAFDILHVARRKIMSILGECPALADLNCRFGPGANVSCRKKTTARYKLSSPLGCSIEGLKRIPELKALYPRLFEGREPVLESGEVSMVPKSAKTMRTIEFQPLLNTFVQLGIGSSMKRRLVKAGINLFDQSINKDLARSASLAGSGVATVDWSSASDSVSVRLVWELLPPDWFDLLSDWRCGSVTHKNLSFNCDKFSAMGNGYTFELESLIFYALAFAVCITENVTPDPLSIYGDDLIVPSAVSGRLLDVFSFFGFVLNREKSFFAGPFRESCGGDYLLGVDVRPTYVKSRLTPARLFRLHNDLYRKYEFEAAAEILRFIPRHLRLYGPDGYGDGHLLGHYEPVVRHKLKIRGFCGHSFFSWCKIARRDDEAHVFGDTLLPGYVSYLREKQEALPERATDPYVLRGGDRCRKLSIYVLA